MAKANLTKKANISASVREIDFVTRFGLIWDSLREILGIMRPIRKAPGTKLTSYTASVTLQSGNVGEGEEIPYSLATISPVAYADLTLEKYAKAVSIEAVEKYGAAIAVQKTDAAFLNELQGKILDRFYTFLQTGTLTSTESTFQMAVAMAIGKVRHKFKSMRRDITKVVVFVHTLDAYRYLGAADVTIQSAFGLNYIKDFLGADVMILTSEIPQGKVIGVPSDNIDLYYTDPGDSDYGQLGLDYTVQGETNLIGFHVNGNYNTAVGEAFALMGMALWAEYLDGIAVITVPADSVPAKPVYVVGPVSTVETDATIVSATLNKSTVAADDTAKVAVSAVGYNITPATAPTLSYQWQVRAKTGTVWTDLTDAYTGYNTAELTVKAADAEKHYRCKVTASGSATGTIESGECDVEAASTP